MCIILFDSLTNLQHNNETTQDAIELAGEFSDQSRLRLGLHDEFNLVTVARS